MEIKTALYDSPLGTIVIRADEEVLYQLDFSDGPGEYENETNEVIRRTISWLDRYFGPEIPDFRPPLRLEGTPFQKRVWELTSAIPYGETRSYGQLAESIAEERGIRKMSAQAVGNALGRNPICIIVPCHRVVGTDGSLVGYGGGLQNKEKLLELERR